MALEEPVPTADEISSQLALMLASERFRGAKNPADFLELVVTRALAGKKITGLIIGQTLFRGKYKTYKSTDVRVTANTLRKKLKLYWENEGRDDLVIIRLPEPPEDKRIKLAEGEAYRPIFTYNPNSEIAKEYALGLYFLSPKRPYELSNAMQHFRKVWTLSPYHVGACIGTIEASCLLAFFGWNSSIAVNAALESAPIVGKLDRNNWHAHAAAGAAWLLGMEIKRAKEAFDRAIALNQAQTLQYGWYHFFLLVTGQENKAVALARRRAETEYRDAMVNSIYALFLYATRNQDEAILVTANAIELDANCWVAYLARALTNIARGEALGARINLRIMDQSLQKANEPFFPGLMGLAYLLDGNESNLKHVHAFIKYLTTEDKPSPIQNSLFHIGYGTTDAAINYLNMAWSAYEPVVLLLHLLPIFDALRDDDRFQKVIKDRLEKRPQPAILSEPKWKSKPTLDLPQSVPPAR